MINSKQRKHLKSLANTMDPKVIIGKNGITENLLTQIDDTLEANELVKIKILNNNLDDHNDLIQEILKELSAEFVSHMGNKFVIYRQSEDKIITLP
ncbi:ribosome assembly RNA-binding protein YhbY [uncultured Helcococcus sp.]|uniref:ribosome assembly RNA-binding protein YhbY n=1 Tax=uncultured Helcococcus sp. TaxID=1072508 RepID=UPI002615C39E|nr:ribosome assembly RNA-binding protein YhbY [uncultured Helcococcus sp.]